MSKSHRKVAEVRQKGIDMKDIKKADEILERLTAYWNDD